MIPDQLVKKLAGQTLIERALNTARACVSAKDVITFTDSEEIGLICERAGTRFYRNSAFRFKGLDIVAEMRSFLEELAKEYANCIILRPSSPLLTWVDLENAWKKYLHEKADSLITVKRQPQRIWKGIGENLDSILADEASREISLIETRALIILKLSSLGKSGAEKPRVIPFFLDERGLEIESYQDWWLCEKLLERRHVVFVVAGYPAIGMGHVFRALMLAHEISSHKITFICTRESGLAVENVTARDYRVVRQGSEPLHETVLRQRPDLVINDFLDTDAGYMDFLRNAGLRCVNFEDQGSGAKKANLVINALYDAKEDSPHTRCGPAYFCLRDEFAEAARNPFREKCATVLITFGGTDQRNFTSKILELVAPLCNALKINIRIVAGPGYAHKAQLEKILHDWNNPLVEFTSATNIMSRKMEGADLAICSAGRTVYELCHMRIPAIIFATHKREAAHGFGRWKHGFAFAGLMDRMKPGRFMKLFTFMLNPAPRRECWNRQNSFSFAGNKQRVIGLLMDQLEKTDSI